MLKCPRENCKGFLREDSDGYEEFLTCGLCERSYDLEGKPREIFELKKPKRVRPDSIY